MNIFLIFLKFKFKRFNKLQNRAKNFLDFFDEEYDINGKISHIKEFDKYNHELLFSEYYLNGKRNGYGEQYRLKDSFDEISKYFL